MKKYLVTMDDFTGTPIVVPVFAADEGKAMMRAEKFFPGWLALEAKEETNAERA